MHPTGQDPLDDWLITAADLALRSVHDAARRERICRHMSGWFARRAVTAAEEDAPIEHLETPLLPPAPEPDE